MTNELTTHESASLASAGQAANRAAAAAVFADYQSTKAAQTLRRQRAGLALFAEYLLETTGSAPEGLALGTTPAAWSGMTWGIVKGFVSWLLSQGYSIGTINVRLATIRTYARLAAQAGAIDPQELTLILAVKGYSARAGKNVNERRQAADLPIRQPDSKKAHPVEIDARQAAALKNQGDNPQGLRDRLIVYLMLDHGLRVGELARLKIEDLNLKGKTLTFYRPKVDRIQTHRLTKDTAKAARAYLLQLGTKEGPLLWGSRKNGELSKPGMAEQNITLRIKELGAAAGIEGLSAHDLRHYWATTAARKGTPIDRLQDAGGWSNPVTPLTKYIQPAKIANEGVILE